MTGPIDERVIAMISTLGKLPIDQIEPESRLVDLAIDSLVIVELSFKLKQEFSISEETDQKLDDAETVQDIIDLVTVSKSEGHNDSPPSTEHAEHEKTIFPSS